MPTDEELAECREWLERVVRVDCVAGLYDEANILEALEEIIEVELGEPAPTLLDELTGAMRAGLEARAREEATWRERTINDRIDSAFSDLEARGILTAQALGSTLQEGAARIDERRAEQDPNARGCVFYHRQDLERGVDGEGLMLAFTGYGAEADAAEAVGREIVHVLMHHGVPVVWNGSAQSRIRIQPFVWQKRRTTKPPSGASVAPPYAPPPPPAVCALCKGRGWVATNDPATPAVACSCTKRG